MRLLKVCICICESSYFTLSLVHSLMDANTSRTFKFSANAVVETPAVVSLVRAVSLIAAAVTIP